MTDLQKQIDKLKSERSKHHRKYLYGGSNVWKDSKRKRDELDRQIKELETKLDKSQPELT